MKKRNGTILVVDDEPIIRDTLAEFLGDEGYDVAVAADGEAALKSAAATLFDIVLCDVNLPGLDGMDVLEHLTKHGPETFVILMTAYATVETAVEAFQRGAHDYLMKPLNLGHTATKIERLLRTRDLFRENQWLRKELSRDASSTEMVTGKSAAMAAAYTMARKVAPTPTTVLILGESGTGKELMAQAIHRFAQDAKQSDGRFLAVNCAAIPAELMENQLFGRRKGAFTGADRDADGIFIHAGSGTVFLDEIGEMPLSIQAKLLRAIEQKEVLPVGANEPIRMEARILAATNKDLAKEAAAGRFREDLFYRLNVVTITLPPLRERLEDIPELVDVLLAKQARALGRKITGLTYEAMQLLLNHAWKGNIRELDNTLQRAVILGEGPLLTVSDLPPDLTPGAWEASNLEDLNQAAERFEKLHIERLLRLCPDKRDAAKRLGIGLSSLYRKIEQLGIKSEAGDA